MRDYQELWAVQTKDLLLTTHRELCPKQHKGDGDALVSTKQDY